MPDVMKIVISGIQFLFIGKKLFEKIAHGLPGQMTEYKRL
jgi:hypothetical protein